MTAVARGLGWPAATLLTLLAMGGPAIAQSATQLCAMARKEGITVFVREHCAQPAAHASAPTAGSPVATDALRKGEAAELQGDNLANAGKDDDAGAKWDEALRWYRIAAAQGNSEAEYYIGDAYSRGLEDSPDEAAAIKWYQRAAAKGNFDALNHLGDMYLNGYDDSDEVSPVEVPQDYPQAMRWFRLAAAKGDTYAMTNLGEMYSEGYGTAKDYAEAMRWYRLAADKGDTTGLFEVGYMYLHGQGVAQDYAEVERWFRRAADKGDANSQDALAQLYIDGHVTDSPDATTRGWIATQSGGKQWLAQHPQ